LSFFQTAKGSYRNLHAHKLILSSRSPVFEGMFYGPLANSTDVILDQFEYSVVDLFLR